MIKPLSFTSGLYLSNKVFKKADKKTLEQIDDYAEKTNSDIFITSCNKNPKTKQRIYSALTVNNGKFFYQSFDSSDPSNPTTKDYFDYTRILKEDIFEKQKPAKEEDIKNITFIDKKAYSKTNDKLFSGVVKKDIDNYKNNSLMILKIKEGKILSSEFVDENNNTIQSRFYGYDDNNKHIGTVKYTPFDITFITHRKNDDMDYIEYRDKNYTPTRLIGHSNKENTTTVIDF